MPLRLSVVVVTPGGVKTCSTVKLNSCVCLWMKAPVDVLFFSKPCIFISGALATTASARFTLTRSRLSPNTQAISVRDEHCELSLTSGRLDCTSTSERTQVVVTEHCLLFVPSSLPLPSHPPPFLSCLCCGGHTEETEALFMSLLNLLCSSVSLSPWRGPQQTTVLPCCVSKSSFYLQPLASSASLER